VIIAFSHVVEQQNPGVGPAWVSPRPRARQLSRGTVAAAGLYPAGTLRNQNNLSVGTGLEYLLVGVGGLGERQLFPDHGPQGIVL
jgi:hypothetical protein